MAKNSLVNLCKCSVAEKNANPSTNLCNCGCATLKLAPSEVIKKKSVVTIRNDCNCSGNPNKIEIVTKSSHCKVRYKQPQKIESGKKNVTGIYLPSGPLDFLKACFGPNDYCSSENTSKKNSEKVKSRQSHASNLSDIGEEELRTVMLSESKGTTCHNFARRVLCDVKFKFKPGSNSETCRSYWNKQSEYGTEKSTSIKVNATTVSSSGSTKESKGNIVKTPCTCINASDKFVDGMDEKEAINANNELLRMTGDNQKRASILSQTKVSVNRSKQKESKTKNDNLSRFVQINDICEECCIKNHCIDIETNTEILPTISFAGQTTEIKECNDDTCEVLKILQKEVKQLTSFNEIKSELQSTAVQAICMCDAETQGYDMKYTSSTSKELFCKSKLCKKKCRRCSMVQSLYNGSSRQGFNDTILEDPRKDLSLTQCPMAAITTNCDSNNQLLMNCPFREKTLSGLGANDSNNCQYCEAIWQLISRVEVITVATFFVCMLFYLCFTKMSHIFNQSNCRHTFC